MSNLHVFLQPLHQMRTLWSVVQKHLQHRDGGNGNGSNGEGGGSGGGSWSGSGSGGLYSALGIQRSAASAGADRSVRVSNAIRIS
jgi:hypothetical protein